VPNLTGYWLLTTCPERSRRAGYLNRALNLGFVMMSLVGYILIVAVAIILILLARVLFFILREEQAVEIELREIEKNSTH
jgi:hypothetical protein